MSDLDFFVTYRNAVADEICRLAAAGRVAPERLALGVANVPEGTDAGAVGRALWGPFITLPDVYVGLALTRFVRHRQSRVGQGQERYLNLTRN
jgi:hypothetical protein